MSWCHSNQLVPGVHKKNHTHTKAINYMVYSERLAIIRATDVKVEAILSHRAEFTHTGAPILCNTHSIIN